MERTITPDTLKALLGAGAPPTVLDVRRPDDRAKDPTAIPGAIWHNPAAVAGWVSSLPVREEIVLHCVRGGSVSNAVLDALLAQGFSARYIEGGLEAWKAAGGTTESPNETAAVPQP